MSTYLIYRPCLDYEDSIAPLVVCDTRKHTEEVRQELITWCKRVNRQLTQFDEDAVEKMNQRRREDYGYRISMKRRDEIAKLDGRYPYGVDALKEVFNEFQNDFTHQPESFLEVRQITYLRP